MKNSGYGTATKALAEFLSCAESMLRGEGVGDAAAECYLLNPAEWHRRMFDVLMAVATAAQRIHGKTQAALLAHATQLSPSELDVVLRSTLSLGPAIESAVTCWEVSRDLAYEEFGPRFHFPPPRRPSRA